MVEELNTQHHPASQLEKGRPWIQTQLLPPSPVFYCLLPAPSCADELYVNMEAKQQCGGRTFGTTVVFVGGHCGLCEVATADCVIHHEESVCVQESVSVPRIPIAWICAQ